jgi:hypothetical protein
MVLGVLTGARAMKVMMQGRTLEASDLTYRAQ